LQQAAYYDLNPVSKGHWTNVLFGDKRDPVSRLPLEDPDNYARMFLNPSDNEHLTKDYLNSLSRLPERQRKRFFEGVYVDDLDGALFSYEVIARGRVTAFAPERCRSIVVAVDPSAPRARTTSAPTRSALSLPRGATTATLMCSPTDRCATRRRCGGVPRCAPIMTSLPTASSPRKISAAKWFAS
jgi:hypothetical protein